MKMASLSQKSFAHGTQVCEIWRPDFAHGTAKCASKVRMCAFPQSTLLLFFKGLQQNQPLNLLAPKDCFGGTEGFTSGKQMRTQFWVPI